ncbi:MAG: NAD(P)/FAD-dependent oxidoreductase, partial [Nanopusillaceae archaeon]
MDNLFKIGGEMIKIQSGELDKEWDVIIIGGGPAGLAAALYSGRYRLKTLVITQNIGGLLNEINLIDDYLGFESISGPDLAKKFRNHVEKFGVKFLIENVVRVEKLPDERLKVFTSTGKDFISKAVIIATGSQRKKLGIPGENLPGVSYCAECDAAFFKDKVVGVV